MNEARGIKEGRILVVVWTADGEELTREYYSSIGALFRMRTPEQVGASRNTVTCMLSRNNGHHETKRCAMFYAPLYRTDRGPKVK